MQIPTAFSSYASSQRQRRRRFPLFVLDSLGFSTLTTRWTMWHSRARNYDYISRIIETSILWNFWMNHPFLVGTTSSFFAEHLGTEALPEHHPSRATEAMPLVGVSIISIQRHRHWNRIPADVTFRVEQILKLFPTSIRRTPLPPPCHGSIALRWKVAVQSLP